MGSFLALSFALLLSFGPVSLAGDASDEFYVEAGAFTSREEATASAVLARKAGLAPRVVKRFLVNRGFEFVLVVDGLPDAAAATIAASALESATAQRAVVLSSAGPASPAAQPPDEARTAAQWVASVSAAVGGAAGGSDALARAAVVHFVFERTLRVGEKEVTFSQDYWRDGTNRRLDVKTFGGGTDSTAVTTAASAWIRTGATVTPRDIGVLVGTIDAFSPESMLTVALGAHDLLRASEVQRFTVLEGADGLRLGTGGDESESGLAWIDIDPETSLLEGVRLVTNGGPIEWDLRSWKEVAPGVVIPMEVHVRRADGRRETVKVKTLEVLTKSPDGEFAP
ncbi:MAG: hypothetical protein EXR69_15835 [Myxococcales bacterium]|nr:hypothetical protein [Myxococcales bacterium]